MANKPKIILKKNERAHGKKEGEKREKTTATLSEKKVKASNVSEETGQRLDTRNSCTRYNPLSSDSNTAGQQTLTKYPTQRKNEGSR